MALGTAASLRGAASSRATAWPGRRRRTSTSTGSGAGAAASRQAAHRPGKVHTLEELNEKYKNAFTREDLAASFSMHYQKLAQLYDTIAFSHRALGVFIAGFLVGASFLVANWGEARQIASRESAEFVAETIRDEQLRYDAKSFSKELIHQILTDEEVAKTAAEWTHRLLVSLQDEIGSLFVRILHQEQVVDAVNRLADRLVGYLCGSRTIQELVGRLLVDAICLQTSRDASAQWACDLVMRDDVVVGFRDLVVTALRTKEVVDEAQSLGINIVNNILQDSGTVSEAKRTLNDTLRDSELQAAAKDSLWSIVSPWPWGKTAQVATRENRTQRAVKALDELLSLDVLTDEERLMLRSLQARMRSGKVEATTDLVESLHSSSASQEPTAITPEPAPVAAPEEAGAMVVSPPAVADVAVVAAVESPPAAVERSAPSQAREAPAAETSPSRAMLVHASPLEACAQPSGSSEVATRNVVSTDLQPCREQAPCAAPIAVPLTAAEVPEPLPAPTVAQPDRADVTAPSPVVVMRDAIAVAVPVSPLEAALPMTESTAQQPSALAEVTRPNYVSVDLSPRSAQALYMAPASAPLTVEPALAPTAALPEPARVVTPAPVEARPAPAENSIQRLAMERDDAPASVLFF